MDVQRRKITFPIKRVCLPSQRENEIIEGNNIIKPQAILIRVTRRNIFTSHGRMKEPKASPPPSSQPPVVQCVAFRGASVSLAMMRARYRGGVIGALSARSV